MLRHLLAECWITITERDRGGTYMTIIENTAALKKNFDCRRVVVHWRCLSSCEKGVRGGVWFRRAILNAKAQTSRYPSLLMKNNKSARERRIYTPGCLSKGGRTIFSSVSLSLSFSPSLVLLGLWHRTFLFYWFPLSQQAQKKKTKIGVRDAHICALLVHNQNKVITPCSTFSFPTNCD